MPNVSRNPCLPLAVTMTALLLMYNPAKKLSRVNANLQQAIAASERIFELLDNVAAMVTGREVFGFFKQTATLMMPIGRRILRLT